MHCYPLVTMIQYLSILQLILRVSRADLYVQTEIQARYTAHRTTRNSQQKAKMLDKNFSGVNIDPILLRLCDPTIEPGYVDPRHCLVFWARPTQEVKDLILKVQKALSTVAPSKPM